MVEGRAFTVGSASIGSCTRVDTFVVDAGFFLIAIGSVDALKRVAFYSSINNVSPLSFNPIEIWGENTNFRVASRLERATTDGQVIFSHTIRAFTASACNSTRVFTSSRDTRSSQWAVGIGHTLTRSLASSLKWFSNQTYNKYKSLVTAHQSLK